VLFVTPGVVHIAEEVAEFGKRQVTWQVFTSEFKVEMEFGNEMVHSLLDKTIEIYL